MNWERIKSRTWGVWKDEGWCVLVMNIKNKIASKMNPKLVRFLGKTWRSFALVFLYRKLSKSNSWIIDEKGIRVTSNKDYKKLVDFYKYRSDIHEKYISNKTNPPKEYIDLKFAVYFQVYDHQKATFEALKSLRNFYPEVKVCLLSDAGEDFSKIAKHFNCDYIYDKNNLAYWPCKDMVAWFKRLYDACSKYKDVDWILIMEDDVRVRDRISKEPNAHIAGQGGGKVCNERVYGKEAKQYLKTLHPNLEINGFSGCGGTIFHRESFMRCYENISAYDIQKLKKLDPRLEWATDIILTFFFNQNGFVNRRWLDFSMEDQGYYGPAAAVDHYYKRFYSEKLTEKDIIEIGK